MPAEMPAGEVRALADALEGHGVAVWIDGGWGVDALLRRQTRAHADLDIVLAVRDAVAAERLLRARGYADVPRDHTRWYNFVLGDRQGHEVDFHLVTFDGKGDGVRIVARGRMLSGTCLRWRGGHRQPPRAVPHARLPAGRPHRLSAARVQPA